MANVKIPKKIFEKEIKKLNDQMLQKIASFGTTVESLTEDELELDITPDRPDLLSYHGYKRSFVSFLGKKTGLKKYKINPPEKNFEVKIDPSVKDVRPFTACAIIKGLKLNDEKIKEIIELQEKLHSTVGRRRKKLAIGIYPLEKIKLPIFYKAIEPDKIKFTPLEARKEMSGLEILQKHPTGKEYSHLLAGKAKFPIFHDADNQILSMPPIINSEKTGRVSESTTDVFIECSGFDHEILNKCLVIITSILAEMGGQIYQIKLKDKITPNFSPKKTKISIENVSNTIGINLKEKEIKLLLEKMGHDYSNKTVVSPPWRIDILHEIDLIEDIAIAYGYENIIPEIPKISTIGQLSKETIIKNKISEILTNLSMLEVSNYHLTKKSDQFEKMQFSKKDQSKAIELENSKTENSITRNDLTHYLMKNLSENIDSEYPQKIFEMGRIFNINQHGQYYEEESLACAIAPGNFTDIKQILDYLFKNLQLEFTLKETDKKVPYFIEGRNIDILLDNKVIGKIGEIHPKILKNWKIKMPIALFEINLDQIINKF